MIAALLIAAALSMPTPPETVAEIRIHGNATVTDERVIEMTGVSVGAVLAPGEMAAIEKRLRDSGCFDEVDVRKRYRSLQMDEVSLVVMVHEVAGVSSTGQPPSGFRQWRNRVLFLPVLGFEDGYGWTYGARASFIDTLGGGERISVPATWGGERRLSVEADRTFKAGLFSRVSGAFGLVERDNPYYGVTDERLGGRVRAERRLLGHIVIGAVAGREGVTFGAASRPQWTAGADVSVDTRRDPSFPIDAIVASVGWDQLHAGAAVNRYRYAFRGYRRVYRQAVVAARVQLDTASAPLPAHEQWLLGGTLLRGVAPGSAAGDKRVAWSGEVRVPVSSPLKAGRVGVTAFIDGGAVAPWSVPLARLPMQRDAGAGAFALLRFVTLNVDVARSLDGHGTRVHFQTGFAF